MELVRRTGLLVAAVAMLWLSPVAMAPARADNLGGVFEKCAQLVEFVPPSDTDDGHLTLVGIGPGLYNPVDDTTRHHFPFAPSLVLADTLKVELQALADGLSFTCLRIHADGAPSLTSELAIQRQSRQCGTTRRDQAGIYSLDSEELFHDMELLADADDVVRADFYLGHLLNAATGSATCLNFQLNPTGVVEAITVDLTSTPCGTLFEGATSLVVGRLLLEDDNSMSSQLLPSRAAAAGSLLARQQVTGCVAVEVQGSQIISASLTADGTVCGSVESPEGGLTIAGSTVSSLLNGPQAADLQAALGGSACLDLTIDRNEVTAELTTTPLPPSPTPSPTATPTPPTDATASPTPGASPLAGGGMTPTGASPAIVGLAILGGGALLIAGATGFLLVRRTRVSPAVPPANAQAAADLTAYSDEPAVAIQPSIVSLTRREQEVLEMLYEGLSNKEIGSRLFITESTAGVHVSNILTKLGARSRTEAAALAHRMMLTTRDTLEH